MGTDAAEEGFLSLANVVGNIVAVQDVDARMTEKVRDGLKNALVFLLRQRVRGGHILAYFVTIFPLPVAMVLAPLRC